MSNETEAPERILMSPKDAALFAQKYGHPDMPQPTVGDGFVSYVLSDAKDKRITELEALNAHYSSCWDSDIQEITSQSARIAELEAKLAMAESLFRQAQFAKHTGSCLRGEIPNAQTSILTDMDVSFYRATLEELKGPTQ